MDTLPPLNALRAFDAAGRLCSIAGAAAELCVTSAAISRHIRVLELRLGVRLFFRKHRGIELTAAGHQYHAEVARLFTGLRRATEDVMGHSTRRAFHIRAPHSIAMRWLLPRMAAFHAAHPDIDVNLSTSLAVPDFERDDIDAAVFLGRGDWKGLISHKMIANELVPVCHPGNAARLTRPADLAGEVLLHTLARPDDWRVWMEAAGLGNRDVARGMRYESSALAYEAATQGYGVAIAQKALVQPELDDGRLVMPFDLTVDMGEWSYYVLLPPVGYKRASPELDVFRAWAVSLCS